MGDPKRLFKHYFESVEAKQKFEAWLEEKFPYRSRFECRLTQLMADYRRLKHTTGNGDIDVLRDKNQFFLRKLHEFEALIEELRSENLSKDELIKGMAATDPFTLSNEILRSRIEKTLKNRKDRRYNTVKEIWSFIGISKLDGEDIEKSTQANEILLQMVDEGLVEFKIKKSIPSFRWVK